MTVTVITSPTLGSAAERFIKKAAETQSSTTFQDDLEINWQHIKQCLPYYQAFTKHTFQ